MSIPTVFTNANCDTGREGELNGGGMLRFCRSYDPNVYQPHDVCVINTQEDYNEYQFGCVGIMHAKFVDNNNNTVWVESTPEYAGSLEKPVEFPIGSHDNMHFVPVPHYDPQYDPPYPIFVSKENCDSQRNFLICCPPRLAWSIEKTPPVDGKCVLVNEEYRQSFGICCVNDIYGTYVDPINGTTVTATGIDPTTQLPTGAGTSHSAKSDDSSANPTQDPTGDWNSHSTEPDNNSANSSQEPTDADTPHSTESDSSSAKPTHKVTVTKCLVALLSVNLFLMTTNLF